MACGAYCSNLFAFKALLAEAQYHPRVTVFVHVYGPWSVTSFTADLVAGDLKGCNPHVYIVVIIGVVFVTLKTGFSAQIFGPRRHFRHLDDAGPFFQHLCTANQETHAHYGN
jgi:hypothetical protein